MRNSPAVDAQHRPGRPQARGGDEAAGDLADVVPVRRGVRRLRRLLDLPADLPQGRLRLRPDRQPARAPPASPSPPWSPARSAASSSDRIGPRAVVAISLAGTAVTGGRARVPAAARAAGRAWRSSLIAFFLGLGTGGVFAWVAALAPPERVGSVTGLVGAAGGLGGYFPPLVMGATYDKVFPHTASGSSLLASSPPARSSSPRSGSARRATVGERPDGRHGLSGTPADAGRASPGTRGARPGVPGTRHTPAVGVSRCCWPSAGSLTEGRPFSRCPAKARRKVPRRRRRR